MKKFTTVILAMLLVLVVGQATFAKANVNINAGYTFMNKDEFKGGINFGLSGSYYFTDKFSIAADFSGKFYTVLGATADLDKAAKDFKVGAVVRYDVLSLGSATIGLQAGVMDTLKNDVIGGKNMLFVVAGAYADVNLMEKLNLFADVKIPVFTTFEGKGDNFKAFFYDVKLGVTYDITEMINAGVVVSVDNCDYNTVVGAIDTPAWSNTNIKVGATVGFSF